MHRWACPLTQDQWLYFFTLAVTITVCVAATNLIRTRTGRAMIEFRNKTYPVSYERRHQTLV